MDAVPEPVGRLPGSPDTDNPPITKTSDDALLADLEATREAVANLTKTRAYRHERLSIFADRSEIRTLARIGAEISCYVYREEQRKARTFRTATG